MAEWKWWRSGAKKREWIGDDVNWMEKPAGDRARRRDGEERNEWREVVNTREGSVSVIEERVHNERPLTISRMALELGPLVRARQRSGLSTLVAPVLMGREGRRGETMDQRNARSSTFDQ